MRLMLPIETGKILSSTSILCKSLTMDDCVHVKI